MKSSKRPERRTKKHGDAPGARTLAQLLPLAAIAVLTLNLVAVPTARTWPCMLVVHSMSGLEWQKGSQGIDGRFWPCKELDQYSFAYDLLKGQASGIVSGIVDADAWINHPKAERYEVNESSMLIAPDRLLTLLWWKNEKMITDLLGGL